MNDVLGTLLTEKELLDIVDQLIRDRAYNRPAAIAIGMAVGAAVEAEVRQRAVAAERERCAKVCEGLEEYFTDSRYDPARFAAAIRNGV
jgi:hypothetical protein